MSGAATLRTYRTQIAMAATFCAAYGVALHWLGFNWTSSMPYRVVWIKYGRMPTRGELMIYRYAGEPIPEYGVVAGARFFKRAAGMPGDQIAVEGRTVYVNAERVGDAKRKTGSGKPLDVVQAGTVPANHVFAQGYGSDAFDSRYRQSGLVRTDRIIGVAHVIF